MKFILLSVFIFFFVVMPMYLLNALVMPGIMQLEHSYAQAGAIAQQAAGN